MSAEDKEEANTEDNAAPKLGRIEEIPTRATRSDDDGSSHDQKQIAQANQIFFKKERNAEHGEGRSRGNHDKTSFSIWNRNARHLEVIATARWGRRRLLVLIALAHVGLSVPAII